MKYILMTYLLVCASNQLFGQRIQSGEYEFGLNLAFDTKSNKITGYFENYTGYDEQTKEPRFSCIFYIVGTLSDSQFSIETFYPNEKEDHIKGNIQLINETTINIQLNEDHGGCWNVQHFAEEKVKFSLEKSFAWTQIRFVTSDKAYFYSNKSIETKQKVYVIKNDFVAVEKIEGDWAYCTFYDTKISKGWIKLSDLNVI